MPSIYKAKRIKAGLTKGDMANLLGIDYNRYRLIEKGDMKMPIKLIDKFNEIIEKGRNIHALEKQSTKRDIDEFWEGMLSKGDDGEIKLKNKMKEYNIPSCKKLAILMGYKDGSALSHYINNPDLAPYEFKNRLYCFFNDELNIQLPLPQKDDEKQVMKKNGRKLSEEDMKIMDWYNNEFSLQDYLDTHNLCVSQLSKLAGMSYGTLYNMSQDKYKTAQMKTIRQLYNYVKGNNLEENESKEKIVEVQDNVEDMILDITDTPTDTECENTEAEDTVLFNDEYWNNYFAKKCDEYMQKTIKEKTDEMISSINDKIEAYQLARSVCEAIKEIIGKRS